jgi:hypothetical protein
LGIQPEKNRIFAFYIPGKVIIGKHDIDAFAGRGVDAAAVDIAAVDQNQIALPQGKMAPVDRAEGLASPLTPAL